MTKMKISLIGSGNVATHLALALSQAGHLIEQVYSRNAEHAQDLALKVKARAIPSLQQLNPNVDLLLIAISDKAIAPLCQEIQFQPKCIAHTAGSVPLSVLDSFENAGVFYPLQSFTKEKAIDFKRVPLCIEATNNKTQSTLLELAEGLSNQIHLLNSEQRKECHIAAIFANNFTNHLYHIAADLLTAKDIPFDILQPLIQETAEKIKELHPAKAQTGPAARNDKQVMEAHMQHLKDEKLKKIYSFVSESILAKKHNI